MSSEARELDLAPMMADLCGCTALTETHGALLASVYHSCSEHCARAFADGPELYAGPKQAE